MTKSSLRHSLDHYIERRAHNRVLTVRELKAAMERIGAEVVRPSGKSRCWRLPPLPECRKTFAYSMGLQGFDDDENEENDTISEGTMD